MTRRSCAIYATGIVCAHLLIVGIALVVAQVFQTMIHSRLKKEITLTEKSQVFESWKNPPPPVYMEYYFFNVTNPEEFLAGGKASVKQIGPYTYREYRPRENVTFLENGTKIYALNPKTFVFVPEKSAGDPTVDIIRTVNIPLVAVMNELSTYSFFLRTGVSIYLKSQGIELFFTRTVHEVLWGFEDPLLTKINSIKPEVDKHFGLMWKKNGTHEGEFVFHTGEENYLDYGKIDTWNGLREMSWWSSNQSNMINGTDGAVFHPLINRNELLYIFAADLCRSIHLAYVEDVDVKGIQAYRFAPPSDVLMSPKDNPSNAGFCVPAGDCLGTGVLKVSVCREGAPIVVSFPHFYQADPKYIEAIDGLHPNKEEHETYLDLQPTTGVPIRACKRAQLNIILKRVQGFPNTKFINETIFPIMFVNETATIDDDSAAQMRTLLLIVTLVSNFPLLIVGLGVILLLVLVVLFCRNRQKKNEVKRIDFTEAFHSFTTAKDDTAYTQVSDKPEESSETPASQPMRNGSYIAMSPVEAQKC
ncbi:lysosome membrane protein 2a isoform X1 [Thunnus thynnus]|uniref:lysosome membrane protein 2a isoform X2 n=1 Tax=Thunnus maccoyii TaxID=8240 RepID=UPI001C4CB233|nr:lysosome membrane protein 2a isoform X2 [Thunnus maccoyii]XP_042276487.1 lysosome membrane protein 2a isoform X2 [Thunnus maccoyii]XP_042276488.1 lysosome membrane protein 2a isoform X2 [Thunnus maccoyii]XP_042276489.1 lysosome membrane protein 2a isoform X2 [Thunnus maccoyii]XP_042276490.1 lysosome membrane protein 2a isoform X2 [Thunnus maccoyii]